MTRIMPSVVLVALQFLLILAIAFPFSPPALRPLPMALFGAGLMIFALSLRAMQASTFSVMPEPRKGGVLVTHGIYRFVRHPMYLAVLLCALAACLAYGDPFKWIGAVCVMAVLRAKMRREEALLQARFDEYAVYRAHSKAIIPFLY